LKNINNKVNKHTLSYIWKLPVKICPPKVTRLGTARPIFREYTKIEGLEDLEKVYKHGKRGYYP